MQEMLRKFEKYGDVDKARIVRNNINGESRGFGFVQMMDEDGADKVPPLNSLALIDAHHPRAWHSVFPNLSRIFWVMPM